MYVISWMLGRCSSSSAARHRVRSEHHASSLLTDRAWRLRAKCTTARACWCPVAGTCATAWTWTAWAASTHVPTVGPASVASSAAATGSGCMNRWRWRGARSSGTSLQTNRGEVLSGQGFCRPGVMYSRPQCIRGLCVHEFKLLKLRLQCGDVLFITPSDTGGNRTSKWSVVSTCYFEFLRNKKIGYVVYGEATIEGFVWIF